MQLAPLFPLLHQVLRPAFPGCLWCGSEARRAIALTFDDGPHPQHTPQLLEVLQHYQVKASFFLLGLCVQRFPEVARQVYEQGHWLGLHGYDHIEFPRLSAQALQASLLQTKQAIAQACHLDLVEVQQRIRDVRPPNGIFTPATLSRLRQWGYRPVMWSVVPEDWVRPGVEVVTRRVLQQVRHGSLIVLHDGHCGGQDVAATAAQLIPLLLQQGYEFVSVDQLWLQHQNGCAIPDKTTAS